MVVSQYSMLIPADLPQVAGITFDRITFSFAVQMLVDLPKSLHLLWTLPPRSVANLFYSRLR
jgi:hypothetical protein